VFKGLKDVGDYKRSPTALTPGKILYQM